MVLTDRIVIAAAGRDRQFGLSGFQTPAPELTRPPNTVPGQTTVRHAIVHILSPPSAANNEQSVSLVRRSSQEEKTVLEPRAAGFTASADCTQQLYGHIPGMVKHALSNSDSGYHHCIYWRATRQIRSPFLLHGGSLSRGHPVPVV